MIDWIVERIHEFTSSHEFTMASHRNTRTHTPRATALLVATATMATLATLQTAHAADSEMYLLVRQYTPTFCLSEDCEKDKKPEMMTIHGLWPNGMTYDDPKPAFCTKEKFDVNSLSESTISRLNCAWITSLDQSNEGFWSYEWNKHGTCSNFKSQEEYFSTTLDLNDKYDLNVAFANAGISFSGRNDRPSVSELQDAMRKEFGVGGQVVKCENSNDLFEIYMCFNWNTLEPFECDSSYWNTCGKASSTVDFPEGDGEEASTCTLTKDNKKEATGSPSSSSSSSSATYAHNALGGIVGSLVALFV